MAVAANKRPVMTLFSGANCMYSHQVRIVLAEKGVSVDIHLAEKDNLPALFPTGIFKSLDGIKRLIAVRTDITKDYDSAELILNISSDVACDQSGNIITYERATKHGGKVLKFTTAKATSKSPKATQLVEFWSREADPKPESWLKSRAGNGS